MTIPLTEFLKFRSLSSCGLATLITQHILPYAVVVCTHTTSLVRLQALKEQYIIRLAL